MIERLVEHLVAVERSSAKVLELLRAGEHARAYAQAEKLHHHLAGLRASVEGAR